MRTDQAIKSASGLLDRMLDDSVHPAAVMSSLSDYSDTGVLEIVNGSVMSRAMFQLDFAAACGNAGFERLLKILHMNIGRQPPYLIWQILLAKGQTADRMKYAVGREFGNRIWNCISFRHPYAGGRGRMRSFDEEFSRLCLSGRVSDFAGEISASAVAACAESVNESVFAERFAAPDSVAGLSDFDAHRLSISLQVYYSCGLSPFISLAAIACSGRTDPGRKAQFARRLFSIIEGGPSHFTRFVEADGSSGPCSRLAQAESFQEFMLQEECAGEDWCRLPVAMLVCTARRPWAREWLDVQDPGGACGELLRLAAEDPA